jgi:thiol-disulfide isomerase/thioredoxin
MQNNYINLRMKHLIYLFTMVLICSACNKSPEEAYQACLDAEKLYNNLDKKYEEAQKAGTLTPELKATLDQEAEDLFENAKSIYANFFGNYINTPFAQQIFSETRWTRRLNQIQLELVVTKVNDPIFKETEVYKNAANRVEIMKNTKPGHSYTNIISLDPEGNPFNLSNYVGKGKYILLDFWASWCPDCRKEMPLLVELYNTYKDKNFEIIGYSLDKKADAWKQGIEDLSISWPQMSDCDFWNSQGARLYAVQSIPQLILINPEGIIVDRGLSADELLKKLSEIVK